VGCEENEKGVPAATWVAAVVGALPVWEWIGLASARARPEAEGTVGGAVIGEGRGAGTAVGVVPDPVVVVEGSAAAVIARGKIGGAIATEGEVRKEKRQGFD
jgi:hypothetical protein